MKIWEILPRKLQIHENLGYFEKENKETKKTMKIWRILRWRLKKHENLANFGRETEKKIL